MTQNDEISLDTPIVTILKLCNLDGDKNKNEKNVPYENVFQKQKVTTLRKLLNRSRKDLIGERYGFLDGDLDDLVNGLKNKCGGRFLNGDNVDNNQATQEKIAKEPDVPLSLTKIAKLFCCTIHNSWIKNNTLLWKDNEANGNGFYIGCNKNYYKFITNQHVISSYSNKHSGELLYETILRFGGENQSKNKLTDTTSSLNSYFEQKIDWRQKKTNEDDYVHKKVYPTGDHLCDICVILVNKSGHIKTQFSKRMKLLNWIIKQLKSKNIDFDKILKEAQNFVKKSDNDNENNVIEDEMKSNDDTFTFPTEIHSTLSIGQFVIVFGKQCHGLPGDEIYFAICKIISTKYRTDYNSVAIDCHGKPGFSGGAMLKLLDLSLCGIVKCDYFPKSKIHLTRCSTFSEDISKFLKDSVKYGIQVEIPTIINQTTKSNVSSTYLQKFKDIKLREHYILSNYLKENKDQLPTQDGEKTENIEQYRSRSPSPELYPQDEGWD